MRSMDRISQLPEPIQHHILSFLKPKKIGRMECLSKAWRSIVHSRPVLEFKELHFLRKFYRQWETHENPMTSQEEWLMNHVEKSIQTVVGQHRTIQKFMLEADFHPLVEPDLDRCLQQLVDAKVLDLTLFLYYTGGGDCDELPKYYILPPFVFMSETITRLRLTCCDLDLCGTVTLPNLLNLSLDYTTLTQDILEKIPSGCPNLETLKLSRCYGLSSVCISSLAKLKQVTLRLREDVTEVKIVATRLGVFEVSLQSSIKIHLSGCESTLRILKLNNVDVTDEELSSFVSKFHGLEEFVLECLPVTSVGIPNQRLSKLEARGCTSLERVGIDAPDLQALEVHSCTALERVDVNTPNLRALKFNGNKLPFYSLNSRFSMNDTIDFYARYYRGSRESLKEILHMLNGHKNIYLIVHSKEKIVCQGLNESFIKKLYDVKYEGITIEVVTFPTYEYLLHHLFEPNRYCKGRETEIMSIVSRDQPSNRRFLQLLNKSTRIEVEETNCCRFKRSNCFKHSLNHVEIIHKETAETLKSLDAVEYEIMTIKLEWISNWNT